MKLSEKVHDLILESSDFSLVQEMDEIRSHAVDERLTDILNKIDELDEYINNQYTEVKTK